MSTPEITSGRLDFDEFCRCGEAWNELVHAAAVPLPFVCHEWIRHWWRHFGAGHEFVALTVSRGPTLVAGLPLALRRVRCLGRPVVLAEIVGTGRVPTRGMGLADKADAVIRGDVPEAVEPLVEGLLGLLGRVDVLDLLGFDRDSPFNRAVTRLAPAAVSVRELERSVSPYLSLDSGWEAYLKTRSGNFRKHLKKYRRLLDAEGSWTIERMGPDDDVGAWMREAMAVNAASWKGDRGTNLFRAEELSAFFLDVVPDMARHGWIDLQVLRVDGQAVAYELCFDLAGRVFSYNGSFRRELARASPGTVLTAAVIESASERGCHEYDMLRGDEGYKSRWSDAQRSESRCIVATDRWVARAYAAIALVGKDRMRRNERVADLADRLFGWMNRLRYRQ